MKAAMFGTLVVLVCGCNNDAVMTADLAMAVSTDMAMPVDQAMAPSPDMQTCFAPPTGPVMCAGQACAAGDTCCVTNAGGDAGVMTACAASCPGGLSAQCNGKAACGGNPCCLTLQGMTPKDVKCTCGPSDCPPTLGLMGGQTRICANDADCTSGGVSTMYGDCCHNTGGNMAKFCFSKNFVGFTMGQVACP